MRAVFVFFLFVSLLLLSSYDDVHAGDNPGRTCYITTHVEKAQSSKFGYGNPALSEIKNTSLSEKKEDLISIEDEDEDMAVARKNVWLTRYFITPAYTSVSAHFNDSVKNRLPFCRHFSYTSSYIYILQRVLRI